MKFTLHTLLVITIFGLYNCKNSTPNTSQTNTTNNSEPEIVNESVQDNANYLVGEFTYFADAAVFKDCYTKVTYSVNPKADIYNESEVYLKLEEYYRENAPEVGKPIYVEIQGYQVPKPEGEEGWDISIVPNKFNVITKAKTPCK